MNNEKELIHGYEIKESITFANDRGFALGKNPNAAQPFVTWQFTEENGRRDYYWGHYFDTEYTAKRDFSLRTTDYQHQYGVAARSVFPEIEIYNYFSTQRPVDIGTFPKTPHEPDSFVNFNERIPVEGGAFWAWGILTYSSPLTDKQICDYELRAASTNPNKKLIHEIPGKQKAQDSDTRLLPDKDREQER